MHDAEQAVKESEKSKDAGLGKSALGRITVLLGAIFLALIGGYGLWRLSIEYPSRWAMIIPDNSSAESPRLAIDAALDSMTDSEKRPVAGAVVPLATFVASDGARISVKAIEGQFYDRSIEPHGTWQKMGDNVLLVTSVDERRAARGNSAEPMTLGCAVPPTPGTIQALGETSVAPCGGVYAKEFGVRWLARLSVIVDENPGSPDQPCRARYGLSVDNGYQDCVRKALGSSLSRLFRMVSDGRYRPVGAIVIPAIGTGVGGLSKSFFYDDLLQNSLIPALQRGGVPPMTIYLQVYRYDTPERWLETRVGIAGAVQAAATKWQDTDHKVPSSEWLTLTGVALAGAVILFALAAGLRGGALRAGFGADLRMTPLSMLAWIAAAVGVASIFKAFVPMVPTAYGPYAQIAAGIVAALLAGPLTRASERAKEALKAIPVETEGGSNASAS